MSVDIRSSDRRRYVNELQAREKEIAAGLLKVSQPPASPKALQETEKRMRREIANSNERRRMQCINAGFSSLRALIPQLEGEKLSKAAILQHTTEYITALEKDKTRLQMQLDHSKMLLAELGQDRVVTDTYVSSSPPPTKRKKRDTESSDEGVGSLSDASDEGSSELQHENVTLRKQLESHIQKCAALEDRNRLLEAQLLSLLQVQAAHTGQISELHPVNLDTRQIQQETLYNREVVEVIASRDSYVPMPRVDNFQPVRPQSPTPERGMSMDMSSRMDTTSPGFAMGSNPTLASSVKEESSPPVVKQDLCLSETNGQGTTSPLVPAADQSSYHHHHNYCHRDHPRRRHRQQALEQQREEEELRRQQMEQQATCTVSAPYRPKHNTQNLENLVEAIRQIEGDRVLCDDRKFYEEEHKLYKRQSLTDESERETSSISDQDEMKSECSGRDSPSQLHHPVQHHFLVSHQQMVAPPTSPENNSMGDISNHSSFSEKYPIASHLLHRPLHPSFYRPGVIVHKQ
ncbi:uncharacterized protein LOC131935100 [Physella acuta]|uniref:uncharacterized protein LOC131935100 n=1 Tax=Physella acuta TaxID=109671 RepID=UPI0027DE0134|nr:uncharacterized protein LOC131935100 [Physella acuta]